MAWVYLDDQFPDHPKVARAGGDAAWLFVCGLAYCKRYSTHGRIPKAQVPKLSDRRQPAKLAQRLVDVDLWEDDGDHYLIHDYTHWNRSQESRSEAGRKAANARWRKADPKSNGHANASQSHSERTAEGDASECTPPLPIPPTSKSSSYSRVSRSDADADEAASEEDGSVIETAWNLLALHDLERRQSPRPVTDAGKWLKAAANRRRAENLAQAIAWLSRNPDGTAEQLVAHLEPAYGVAIRTTGLMTPEQTQEFLAQYRTDDGSTT